MYIFVKKYFFLVFKRYSNRGVKEFLKIFFIKYVNLIVNINFYIIEFK